MQKFVIAAFATSVLLLATTGVALYQVTIGALESAAYVGHATQVLRHVGGVNAGLGRAEAAQRGFILYGDKGLLAERDRQMAMAQEDAAWVAALTNDASHHEQGEKLTRMLEARHQLMKANAEQRASGGDRAALNASSPIYALTATMAADEQRLLETIESEQAHHIRRIHYVLVAGAALLLFVIVPGLALLVRESRRRIRIERSMEQLAESLPGAVFEYRSWPDGRSQYELLSSATETVRGVDRERALRDPHILLDTIVEADRRVVTAGLAESARTMRPMVMDYRAHVKGHVRWIRVVAAPRRDRDGTVVWTGHWDDVTTQRELEAELLRSKEAADAANRAKSTFLATMSHEIRTPMNGVLGLLELLSLTRLDGEQRSTLSMIRESSRSLLRIIDDILDFSKIEAGKLDLVPEPMPLRQVVERVCDMYKGAASSKGLVLKKHYDSRISAMVMADPVRLQQVLANFVSNALKFTETGGASISAELKERRDGEDLVQFTVSDTGIGLSPEQQAKLFRPFSQAHDGITAQYGGTGLGLTISRRLAEMMGGSIEMESELGRGTRLMFTVPLAIVDGAEAKPTADDTPVAASSLTRVAPSAEEAVRRGHLVLVVDDHPINRMVLLRQINALGYAAETADDGADALAKWATGRFAAVITDCNMPELDGYELVTRIRASEAIGPPKHTIVIACTANAFGGEAERCLAAGMDDYLAKPVTLPQLAQKLDRWLPIEDGDASTSESPPSAAARNDSGVIDFAVLAEISGGDATLERRLLEKFRQHNADDAEHLRSAAASRDTAQVLLYAHRIKGAARAIGANGLASACDHIEQSSRAQDMDRVRGHMAEFATELARLYQVIEYEYESKQSG